MLSKNITIVSIEGNIGSGKSTLFKQLKEYYKENKNVIFLKEPVDEWSTIKDENGITILEKFYADQHSYSFAFQIMAYISRLKILKNAITDAQKNSNDDDNLVIITERSLHTDKMVFAKMLYESGKIELIKYNIYLNWFDTFSEEYPIHKVIYIKAKPILCYDRIIKRSRTGEHIPIEYLNNCDIYHDNMIKELENENICKNNLTLNGDIDIFDCKDQMIKWINEVSEYIDMPQTNAFSHVFVQNILK